MREYKILLFAEFDKYGGTRTYFDLLLQFYSKSQFLIVIALTKEQLLQEIDTIKKYGFRYVVIPRRPDTVGKFPFNLLFDLIIGVWLKAFIRPHLAVLSIGTPGMYIGWVSLFKKFIYILHTYPTEPSRVMQGLLSGFFYKTRLIVTVSEFSKNNIIKYWFNNNNNNNGESIKVISNTAGKLSLTDSCPCNSSSLVLTIGHVEWYKNPLQWIKVAQLVTEQLAERDIKFFWAGDGSLFQKCRRQLQNGLYPNIKFIDFQKDVEQLYYQSAVYFQPSILESQGIAVLDAMRHGLPCVVTDVGGLPESVINNETGYVVGVMDTDSMAEKIITLLTNETLRKGMGCAARCYYQEKYVSDFWEQKMFQLHTEIIRDINNLGG